MSDSPDLRTKADKWKGRMYAAAAVGLVIAVSGVVMFLGGFLLWIIINLFAISLGYPHGLGERISDGADGRG